MEKLFFLISFALLVMPGLSQKRWQKEGIKVPPPICYASDEEHQSFVHAPGQYLKGLKSTAGKKSTIIVTYDGFSDAPKAAFQYAVEIWEHLIASPVPIYIYARWISLDEEVLGSCGPYIYYENFDSAPYKDHYYPVALVAKLEGEVLTNESNPDMVAQFNKDNSNWYYGIDGKTPAGKYDFVSVVLHEIAHGLGFTGFFYEVGGQGAYGDLHPYPAIFDEFVINSAGQQLVDTSSFANPSVALFQQFQSNSLRYESPAARLKGPGDAYPRLYAPVTFDEGSSIYHLNESTYSAGDDNSLMTPVFNKAEAIHDPGAITLGIFADMGWDFTHIMHEKITDSEVIPESIALEAVIKTDSEIDSSSVIFVYSLDFFENADTIQLTYSEEENLFTASLEDPENAAYQYYLSVKDTSERVFFLPVKGPDHSFEFTLGADFENPVVSHVPVTYLLTNDLSTGILVKATDNIGIQSVVMEYFVNDGGMEALSLHYQDNNVYGNTLTLTNLADGDSVRYRIVVTDSSGNSNRVNLPEEGFFTIYIDGFYDPVETYLNDFDGSSRDFILSGFSIGAAPLFDSGALHSSHPYPNSDQDDQTTNLISILKYPIILNDQAMMAFNEVVLVEPGESRSTFGDEDFYDYVIVEGSKNGTDHWLPLIDGYDSREETVWKEAYYSTNTNRAIGKESYYVSRGFKMTANGNFEKGDIIYVRFRLFSDSYEHGWGWAIDDLKIQDPSTDLDKPVYSPGELLVFPNPAGMNLFIEAGFKSIIDQLNISVFNGFGQLVLKELVGVDSDQFTHTLNVNSLQPGLYLLTFEFGNGQRITRKFVKQ